MPFLRSRSASHHDTIVEKSHSANSLTSCAGCPGGIEAFSTIKKSRKKLDCVYTVGNVSHKHKQHLILWQAVVAAVVVAADLKGGILSMIGVDHLSIESSNLLGLWC